MRSKAPLVLMEQVVMVLVFALTAALCLRMFVLADRLSVKYEACDRAVTEAQNVAEQLKQGNLGTYLEAHNAAQDTGAITVWFNQDWQPAGQEEAEYYLQILPVDGETENLWKREIVVGTEKEELFRITVAGQKMEVDEDA